MFAPRIGQREAASRRRAASRATPRAASWTGLCCGRNRKSSKVFPTNKGSISAIRLLCAQGPRPCRLRRRAGGARRAARASTSPRGPGAAARRARGGAPPTRRRAGATRPTPGGRARCGSAPRRRARARPRAPRCAARRRAGPASGTAITSWSMTACGWPSDPAQVLPLLAAAARGDRLERLPVGAHQHVDAARQARAVERRHQRDREQRTRALERAARAARPGSAPRSCAGRRLPAAPAPGHGSACGAKGGTKAWNTTDAPATSRRQRPPRRASVWSNSSGVGSPDGTDGVRTQATFFAKRTSSSSGSGQWRKRSFQGGEATIRSPLSQVRRNAGP